MPYKVLVDGATVHHVVSKNVDDPDEIMVEGVIHSAGDEIADEDLAPYQKKALEEGEAHISSLLEHSKAKAEAEPKAKAEPKPKAEPKAKAPAKADE
jgi:hypothetical protein